MKKLLAVAMLLLSGPVWADPTREYGRCKSGDTDFILSWNRGWIFAESDDSQTIAKMFSNQEAKQFRIFYKDSVKQMKAIAPNSNDTAHQYQGVDFHVFKRINADNKPHCTMSISFNDGARRVDFLLWFDTMLANNEAFEKILNITNYNPKK